MWRSKNVRQHLIHGSSKLKLQASQKFFFFHNAYKVGRLKWVLGAETKIDFEVIIETFEL